MPIHKEIAPSYCPNCRYDLLGMVVGERCPECGAVINVARRSQGADTLATLARVAGWIGVPLFVVGFFCIPSVLALLLLPLSLLILVLGFVLALVARSMLRSEQVYDERARDQLRVPIYAPLIVAGIAVVFGLVELLLMLT